METMWISMSLASLLVAIIAVFCYKQFSRPHRIRRNRNRVEARFIEMFLYQDSLRSLLRVFARLSLAIGSYLFEMGRAILPVGLIIIPLYALFSPLLAKAPVPAEAEFIVETNHPATAVSAVGINDFAAVKIPDEDRILWRFPAEELKNNRLEFVSGENKSSFPVSVKERGAWISQKWTSQQVESLIPGVGILTENDALTRIKIDYPPAVYHLFFAKIQWVATLTLLSLLLSIPIGLLFRVVV